MSTPERLGIEGFKDWRSLISEGISLASLEVEVVVTEVGTFLTG
jgi:hypothetical protein